MRRNVGEYECVIVTLNIPIECEGGEGYGIPI